MQRVFLALVAAAMAAWASASVSASTGAASASPVQKVVQLLSDLEAKITSEGTAAKKMYEELSEWCEDRSKNLQYEVKAATAEVAKLKAAIDESASAAQALAAKIEESVASMAASEADLKAATVIREKEAADFKAEEAELVEVIGMMERAIAILEREMRKGSSALQLRSASSLTDALGAMVKASMLRSQDAKRLVALVQSGDGDAVDDDGEALGAPAPEAYTSHSSSIVETLEGLLDKAKDMLAEARKKEVTAAHYFEMLKQSLTDELKFGSQDMASSKKAMASRQEAKAAAEGDLAVTSKTLEEDTETMSTLKQNCLAKAEDIEAASKIRAEELQALSEAKQVLAEKAGAAGELTYSSLLQLSLGRSGGKSLALRSSSTLRTGADRTNFDAVRLVRKLAQQQHSDSLAQLARRMAAAVRYEVASGEDPFAKVRALVVDMIARLEKDAQADASHKAYCDKETGESLAKKEDKESVIDKLNTKIDAMKARSSQLGEQVADLQAALAGLAKSQGEMESMRREEKAQYAKNKLEMETGLEGVKMASRILREYYSKEDAAHDMGEAGAVNIIGLLEVVESDFSKSLAEMSATEAASQAQYETATKESDVAKATKEQEVIYKTKEYKQIDAALARASSDREGTQSELAAIVEYKGHLLQMCSAKPETYEVRKSRREAEIAGLNEALSILEGEATLLQRRATLRRLRGKGTGKEQASLRAVAA